jgi:hypothetical protein
MDPRTRHRALNVGQAALHAATAVVALRIGFRLVRAAGEQMGATKDVQEWEHRIVQRRGAGGVARAATRAAVARVAARPRRVRRPRSAAAAAPQ